MAGGAEESSERTYALSKCATLCKLHATAPFLCAELPYSLSPSFPPMSLLVLVLRAIHSLSLSLGFSLFLLSVLPFAKCRVFQVLSNDCQVDNLRFLDVLGLEKAARRRLDSSRDENVFKRKGIKHFVRRTYG